MTMDDDEAKSFVEKFVTENVPDLSNTKLEKTITQIYNKPIMLLNEKSKAKTTRRKGSLKHCKYALKKSLVQNYDDYEPLRNLWCGYMNEVLFGLGKKTVDLKVTQEVLLKADLHGATILVAISKCKSLQGVKGTVITESKNIFQIVTVKNRILNIPKKNSVFEIIFKNLRISLFGDQFCIKPSQRLTKKYKNYIPFLNVV